MKVFKIKYLKLAFKVLPFKNFVETDDELRLVRKQRNSFMEKKMHISMTLKEEKKNGTKYYFHIFFFFFFSSLPISLSVSINLVGSFHHKSFLFVNELISL